MARVKSRGEYTIDRAVELLKRCNVPKKIAKESAKHFPGIEQHESGVFFTGPCGSGKTVQASAQMLELLLAKNVRTFEEYGIDEHNSDEGQKELDYMELVQSRYALFVSVPQLLFDIRQTFNRRRDEEDQLTEKELLDKCLKPPLLILDDLGIETASSWGLLTLYLIINYRYNEDKRTIITSNLSLSQLAERFNDDRLTSRINSMCKVVAKKGDKR